VASEARTRIAIEGCSGRGDNCSRRMSNVVLKSEATCSALPPSQIYAPFLAKIGGVYLLNGYNKLDERHAVFSRSHEPGNECTKRRPGVYRSLQIEY
jgi:hypothetical protein